jgi:hypothetical protein
MLSTTESYGAVIAGSSATLFARVVLASGVALTEEEVAEVTYRIVERDPCKILADIDVPGHSGVGLTPGEVFTSALQTTGGWDVDSVGYNFRHEIDVLAAPVFTVPGRRYAVEYRILPNGQQPFVIRFLIEVL